MMSECHYGIPVGNSVAVVGDPGTGKTMLLLSFFAHAKVGSGCVVLGDSKNDNSSLTVFDQLFRPQVRASETSQGDKPEKAPRAAGTSEVDEQRQQEKDNGGHHLRCFVSLESGYSRLQSHYGNLLNGKEENEEEKKKDAVVIVDATSMLSGRLEDMLRYPRLRHPNHNSVDASGKPIILHLGPCGTKQDQGGRCWFWQKDGRDHALDKLLEAGSPLTEALDARKTILITLLCPPVTDTGERVRLLKDLLAILFAAGAANQNRYDQRVFALDSLSALLHEFQIGPSDSDHAPRRLHMLNLVRWLEEQEVTSFMACEARRLENSSMRGHPLFLGTEERYLFSGVIQLDYHRYPSGDLMRYLRVLKMRGAAHDMRGYAYELSENGLDWLEALFGEAQQGGA